MNKNIVLILLIFLVPLAVYWSLVKSKNVGTLPTIAYSGPEIIKFTSPMCYECQELDKIFEEVYPGFANKISLRKINVTDKNKSTNELIKKYEIKLVPTCIFKNNDGNIIRKTEGNIQPRILENYMRELLNG
jgi:thiol-disulfide isomerase/thioredoxin